SYYQQYINTLFIKKDKRFLQRIYILLQLLTSIYNYSKRFKPQEHTTVCVILHLNTQESYNLLQEIFKEQVQFNQDLLNFMKVIKIKTRISRTQVFCLLRRISKNFSKKILLQHFHL